MAELELPPPNMSQSAQDAATDPLVNGLSITSGDYAPPQDPALAVYQQGAGANQDIRFPLDTPLYYMAIGISKYKRDSWASVGSLALESTLALPLPEQLVDAMSQQYGLVELGIGGAAIMGAAQAGLNALKTGDATSVKNAMSGAAQNVQGGALAGLLRTGQRASDTALGALSPNIVPGVLAGLGAAINDYLTVMYKGPNYKTFQFSWKLSPRNQDESRAIKNIELALKNAEAPGWAGGSGSAFFAWPRILTIEFRSYLGDMGDKLFNFKPAVIRGLAFNYAPGGVPAFYGSTQFPEGVSVMMEIEEIELWVNSSSDAQDAYPGQARVVTGTGTGQVNDPSVINQLGSLLTLGRSAGRGTGGG